MITERCIELTYLSTASTTEGSVETSGHFPTGRERGFDEISVSFKPTETKLDSSRLPRSTNTFPRTKKSQHVCIEIPFKPLDLTIFQHIPFLPPSFFLPCQVFFLLYSNTTHFPPTDDCDEQRWWSELSSRDQNDIFCGAEAPVQIPFTHPKQD